MLRAAAVFSDHMVLQRQRPIPVFGEADGEVTVTLAGVRARAEAKDGRFLVRLPAMEAGGPYEMTLTCGGEAVTFRDVAVGEVWLCGGQSNMEFRMRDEAEAGERLTRDEDALLRFYTVNQESKVDEAMLARERETCWKALTPGACGDVSAVAYYAGQRLRQALGVPVGMLICCIGGTEAACWISRQTLEGTREGRMALQDFEKQLSDMTEEEFNRTQAQYQAKVDAWCAASDALKAAKPGIRAVEIAAEIGDFPWPPPVGWWMLRRPAGPWDTMVLRIAPYAARGLFWYQGETDSGKSDRYAALFETLISEWRRGFENPDLFVAAAQLPRYAADPAAEDWPGIRAAQRQVCDRVENCALACLLDCGDSEDLHPWAKRIPGERLANLALKRVYGQPLDAEAPRLKAVEAAEGGLRLRFTKPLAPIRGSLRSLKVDGEAVPSARVADGALCLDISGGEAAYAQENDPEPCLFAEDGLPVEPFRASLSKGGKA